MINFNGSLVDTPKADLYDAIATGNESLALEILNNPHICPTLKEMIEQRDDATNLLSMAIQHCPVIISKLFEVYGTDEITLMARKSTIDTTVSPFENLVKAAEEGDIAAIGSLSVEKDIPFSTKQRVLLSAIKFNHPQAISVLLESPILENMDNKYAAIREAVSCGHIDILNILLNDNLRSNLFHDSSILHDIAHNLARKKMEETTADKYRVIFDRLMQIPGVAQIEHCRLFIDAASCGDNEAIVTLLNEHGHDINDNTKDDALLMTNNLSIINTLLLRCANNISNGAKSEAIYNAVCTGNADILNILLENPSVAALASAYNNDALKMAKTRAIKSKQQKAIYQPIIDRLMQIPGVDQTEHCRLFISASQNRDVDTILALLNECGSDINSETKGRALRIAAYSGNAAIINTLLLHSGNDISDIDKGDALKKVASDKNVAIINALLLHGVEGVSDIDKGNAVVIAVRSANINALNALLANESILAQATYDNNAALSESQALAIQNEQKKIKYQPFIDRLMQIPDVARIEHCRLFINASQDGDVDTIQTLLNESGNDIDDHTKGKALKFSAHNGNVAIINALLIHGIEGVSDIDKGSAVVYAVRSANIDALNALNRLPVKRAMIIMLLFSKRTLWLTAARKMRLSISR